MALPAKPDRTRTLGVDAHSERVTRGKVHSRAGNAIIPSAAKSGASRKRGIPRTTRGGLSDERSAPTHPARGGRPVPAQGGGDDAEAAGLHRHHGGRRRRGAPTGTQWAAGPDPARPDHAEAQWVPGPERPEAGRADGAHPDHHPCLLYTSDAADERSSVDLGG